MKNQSEIQARYDYVSHWLIQAIEQELALLKAERDQVVQGSDRIAELKTALKAHPSNFEAIASDPVLKQSPFNMTTTPEIERLKLISIPGVCENEKVHVAKLMLKGMKEALGWCLGLED